MEELPPGHTHDEEGEHDPESCYECLLQDTVTCECQCGKCCSLIIEADLEDGLREPRIIENSSPIYDALEVTKNGEHELIGYLLNKIDGGDCVFLDEQTKRCGIYATRPLICRLFDCDGEDRECLIELGILERRQ